MQCLLLTKADIAACAQDVCFLTQVATFCDALLEISSELGQTGPVLSEKLDRA
jgi:hypothetical protein